MTYYHVLTTTAFFLLATIQAPAQSADVSIVKNATTTENKLHKVKNTASAKAFEQLSAMYPVTADLLRDSHPDLQNLHFTTNERLLHTFFSEDGHQLHLIFKKGHKKVLEILTFDKNRYPASLQSHMLTYRPDASIVVAKKITSRVSTWYEVLIKQNGGLEKLEIAAL